MPLEDLVLMSEVDARRALAGRRIEFSVLAPLGPVAGRGALRVLRARHARSAGKEPNEETVIELVCGYEAYEQLRFSQEPLPKA